MQARSKLISLCIAILISYGLQAQPPKDSTKIGEVKGIVRDSVYNFVLNSATIAIYKDSDSSLLQFSIPDNFGEFSIKSLPPASPLRLIITHIGYKPFYKKFTIPKSTLSFDFGIVNMYRNDGADGKELDTVVVTAITPMRMNGDTLEFNADAFKLDSTATAEDLMRRLPGFTIWSDGDITYNGKKISSITVNGKPFMGGDFSAITQNLPKNIIDKVQVFKQKNDQNPLDSTLGANLKLKKEITQGHFGKLSFGGGTASHFAIDGMLGIFNKKMQLNMVAAANNINKMPRNINSLIGNSSFKGVGANIDYQPDFRMQGITKSIAAGANFQYDFIPGVNYYNTNRLNADYFLNYTNALGQRNETTNIILGTNNILTQVAENNDSKTSTQQRLKGRYERNTRLFRLRAETGYQGNNNTFNSVSSSEQSRSARGIVSYNNSKNEGSNISKDYSASIYFQKEDPDMYKEDKRFINSYTLQYDININLNNGTSNRTASFRDITNPSANSDYSRWYQKQDAQSITNHLQIRYGGLKKLIFGRARLGGIDLNGSMTDSMGN